ncbi:MAG: hypothetical protein AB9835_14520 [Eubacteriales bacterium]
MKILIGGPVRQDEDIFLEHLTSLRNLTLPTGCEVHRHFIFNDCDLSYMLQSEETYDIINTGDEYVCNEQTHVWSKDNLDKMSHLRNAMLQKTLAEGYDYYLLVDSDLILRPETLVRLLSHKKDLIAELFWTEESPGSGHYWPNAWEYDQCTTDYETIRKWMSKPGPHSCGGTGACFLIHRRVIEAGANYSPLHNIRGLYGEDRFFCIRAVALGFDIWLDNTCQPLHLYRRSIYEKYKRGELNGAPG